jgi:hypothetical protein
VKSHEELLVITKTYDLVLWACHHTSRFPRNHRFVLGDRIERNLALSPATGWASADASHDRIRRPVPARAVCFRDLAMMKRHKSQWSMGL